MTRNTHGFGLSARLRLWLARLTIPVIALVGACLVPLAVEAFSLPLLLGFLARVTIAASLLVAMRSVWLRYLGC